MGVLEEIKNKYMAMKSVVLTRVEDTDRELYVLDENIRCYFDKGIVRSKTGYNGELVYIINSVPIDNVDIEIINEGVLLKSDVSSQYGFLYCTGIEFEGFEYLSIPEGCVVVLKTKISNDVYEKNEVHLAILYPMGIKKDVVAYFEEFFV